MFFHPQYLNSEKNNNPWFKSNLNHDLTFYCTHTINCVCHSIRSMFLGHITLAPTSNFVVCYKTKILWKLSLIQLNMHVKRFHYYAFCFIEIYFVHIQKLNNFFLIANNSTKIIKLFMLFFC